MKKDFIVIAGPCAVESKEQIIKIAKSLKEIGVDVLRGGAFKPRTNPNSFQGLQDKGIKYLLEAKKITGLPVITELLTIDQVKKYGNKIDIIQIGSRNMYNYELLKEVGKLNKPVMLKRGLSATYNEWLLACEYIRKNGNHNIIVCERGIRSFDNSTRNVLDLQSIPYIKKHSDFPIIIDPSHSVGNNYMIESMCCAATAAGCDGIMVEVHNNPSEALCDKEQALTIEEFSNIFQKIIKIKELRKNL